MADGEYYITLRCTNCRHADSYWQRLGHAIGGNYLAMAKCNFCGCSNVLRR